MARPQLQPMRSSFRSSARLAAEASLFSLPPALVAGGGGGGGGGGSAAASAPYRPGLDRLAADLNGNVGLLFTSRPPAQVRAFFASYGRPDFARAGFEPAASIALPAGRLEELPHTMADTLRKLGVPVRLDKGVVVVTEEVALCRAGEPITPEQGRLLKLFGHQLAVFSVTLLSMWQRGAAPAPKGKGKKAGAAAAAAAAADEGPGGLYTRIAPLHVTGGAGEGAEEIDDDA